MIERTYQATYGAARKSTSNYADLKAIIGCRSLRVEEVEDGASCCL